MKTTSPSWVWTAIALSALMVIAYVAMVPLQSTSRNSVALIDVALTMKK